MANNNPEGFTPIPEQPEVNIEATVETPARPDEMDTETVDAANTETKEDKKPSRLVKGIAGTVAGAVVLGGGIFGGLKLFGGENSDNPVSEPSVSGPEVPGPTETETASNELITPNQELPPQKYIGRSELVELSDSELREKCVVRVGDPGTETPEGLVSVFVTKLTEAVQPYSEKLVDTYRKEGQLTTDAWMPYAEEAGRYANRCTSFIYNNGKPADADSPAEQSAKSVAYTNIITQDFRETNLLAGNPADNTDKYIWIKSDVVKGSVKKQALEGRFAEYTYEEIVTNNDEETMSEDIGTKGSWKGKYGGRRVVGINANDEYYLVDYNTQLPAGEEK